MKKKKLYRWFSICSLHKEYKSDCGLCECGKWVFMPTYYVEHFLYSLFPWLWRWYKNRPKRKGKWLDEFVNKEIGEKENPFPNLREKKED